MWKDYEKFENVSTEEKEFFYYLGLLSTKYAAIETALIDVIGCALKTDSFIANITLERNTLSQNIELLKKLVKHYGWQKEHLEKLIQRITSIRGNRNLFIHGIWDKPYKKKNGKFYVNCRESKLELLNNRDLPAFTFGRIHSFELDYIKNLTWELRDIQASLERIAFDYEDGIIK